MSRLSNLGIMVAAMTAAVGVVGVPGSLAYQPVTNGKPHDPERLAKAQAKRDRRAARNLKTKEPS